MENTIKDGSIDKVHFLSLSEDEIRYEKFRIKKNFTVVSLTFLLTFTAFEGLGMLQSSLHKVEGIGVITQCLVYLFMVMSSLFLSNCVVSNIGYKWTMTSSLLAYISWTASNGYAVWATMVPSSIIVGLFGGNTFNVIHYNFNTNVFTFAL